MPYQPETGLGAKSNDPYSFVPYKTAVQASGYDGIGIGIFNGICAIDLDNCVSDSGYYTQTAAEIAALIQKQQIAVQEVEQIEPHAVPFSPKVMLDRSEYENLAAAAKKFYVQERKESKLQKALDAAMKMISELKAKVAALTEELAEYKSVRGQLRTADLEKENGNLRSKLRSYETVISRNNLWSYFSRHRRNELDREEAR